MVWYIVASIVPLISAVLSLILVVGLFVWDTFREGTHILIVQLLLHEILLLIPVYLFNTYIYFTQTNRTLLIDCTFIVASRYTLYTVGHWIHVCLALNRVVAIMFPHYYPLCSNKRSLIGMIVLSWCMGLITLLPFLVSDRDGYYGLLSPAGICGLASRNTWIFSILTSLRISVPLLLQALLYSAVMVTLAVRRCRTPLVPLIEMRRQRRQSGMSVVLFVSSLWYTLCFLPMPTIAAYAPEFWMGRDLLFVWICSLLLFGSAGTPEVMPYL
ncbi:uncharacterized protein LOC129593687 [Paramacrobiotus metropolitanus]|uniref:uncharacterized protein LOC129593687 n=1 Tax=Paramacrobiotus metropolitanus TaxID=2943436 RepID=UPI002445DD4B|nr:uncharacterized protein LOC129593687 [Paramacrobiotus metropolitanus]